MRRVRINPQVFIRICPNFGFPRVYIGKRGLNRRSLDLVGATYSWPCSSRHTKVSRIYSIYGNLGILLYVYYVYMIGRQGQCFQLCNYALIFTIVVNASVFSGSQQVHYAYNAGLFIYIVFAYGISRLILSTQRVVEVVG